MRFDKKDYSPQFLIELYKKLMLPRMIEEKMLILLKQGKITKWFSGIGQEAISVGSTMALNNDEYLLPMHRNLGVFTSRNIPLEKLFAQFQGKINGYTQGRDRSFHFGTKEHFIIGMISHLGSQLSVADGIALKNLLAKENKATVVFTGEGGTSEGDFHEALNVASVWNLPVIFVIENNGYSISTPTHEQYNFESFVVKGPAYGIDAISIDGNNILEVYSTIKEKAEDIRKNPRPILIEMNTFRMRGHEESSGTDYVPQELLDEWAKKDPIHNYEAFLLKENIISTTGIEEIKQEISISIQTALKTAFDTPLSPANTQQELIDIFHPNNFSVTIPHKQTETKRFVDAITESLDQNMTFFPNLVLMGQDIAEFGGVFKVTKGLIEKYGKERVRNTPLCESAIIGIGLGLSIENYKAIIEMQFADFVTCGFNQIVNNLAKSHYRWKQKADIVLRMPTGAGTGAGPFHSQSTEAWFFKTPGLKIVYPSSPITAKGLLNAAIADTNPVLFFEHKKLYRSISEEVPTNHYHIEIGKAHLIHEGNDITIITYGMGVHWAKETLQEIDNCSADLIDLQSLIPWDKKAISNSIKKTGKVILLTEDTHTGSIMAEISAWIVEEHFEKLDAPVMRASSLDTPIPFNKNLEDNFLPQNRFKQKLVELLKY